jgi:predicted nucleotidyltransferase component of viral defense system
MRRISAEQAEQIIAGVNEGLTKFPPGALEKDIHLTEVLRVLQQVQIPNLELVFGGGTSLVKAYGKLNRMSEHLDLKIIDHENLNPSASRTRMTGIKKHLEEQFVQAGFAKGQTQAKNSNKYVAYELRYENSFPHEVSLRPAIKVELTSSPLYLPAKEMPIAALLYRDLNLTDSTFLFPCVAIEQTLAEKVLNLLRRSNEVEQEQEQDDRLIRHVHDVHVLTSDDIDMRKVEQVFRLAVAEGAEKFAARDPDFAANPKKVLQETLRIVSKDPELSNLHTKFVEGLVAGDAPPFEEVSSKFSRVATQLISSLA